MHMDIPHIIKHIANLDGVRLIVKFVFVGFSHWNIQVSGVYLQSSETQTRNLAITLDLSVSNLILSLYYIFR